MRFVIDKDAYHRLVETPERQHRIAALHTAGAIELLRTHVQADEMTANPEQSIRDAALDLPFTQAVTEGFVLGDLDTHRGFKGSKLGLARLADAEELDVIRTEHGGRSADALSATTARREDAVLVTGDHELAKRAPMIGVEILVARPFLGLRRHARRPIAAPVVAIWSYFGSGLETGIRGTGYTYRGRAATRSASARSRFSSSAATRP